MNWRELDWVVIFLWICLVSIGLVSIYSATQGPVAQFLPAIIQSNFLKQVSWVLASVLVIALVQFTAPRSFQQGAYIFYVLTLILLVFTLIFGTEINGAKSWLRVGGIGFQVSELAKVSAILAAANYLTSQRKITAERLKDALITVAILLVPIGLILAQNDLGTALVLIALIPVMLFWSGLPPAISMLMISPAIIGYFTVFNWLWGIIATIVIALFIFILQRRPWLMVTAFVSGITVVIGMLTAMDKVLKPHQVARIQSFVNPAFDPQGNGWNVIQAKTAIGSGGLWGKGFMQGTQTQLRFLPEQWTDFIFCVIGEEFGFVGAGLTLLIFAFFLLRLLTIAGTHKHPFAQLVIVGITFVFFTHMLINIGSASGLLPVIGLPLPFVSYGGSSFLTNSLMLAICLNFDLYHRRFSIYV